MKLHYPLYLSTEFKNKPQISFDSWKTLEAEMDGEGNEGRKMSTFVGQ